MDYDLTRRSIRYTMMIYPIPFSMESKHKIKDGEDNDDNTVSDYVDGDGDAGMLDGVFEE